MDLGECPKVHDLALRADYENAAKNKDYFYDVDVSFICPFLPLNTFRARYLHSFDFAGHGTPAGLHCRLRSADGGG